MWTEAFWLISENSRKMLCGWLLLSLIRLIKWMKKQGYYSKDKGESEKVSAKWKDFHVIKMPVSMLV